LANPLVVASIYAVVSMAVVPFVLNIFNSPFRFIDVAIACLGAAVASLIPAIGGPVSLLAMIALLHWRCSASLFDIGIAVAVARLATVPALIPFA
jgi:hypothetical protein